MTGYFTAPRIAWGTGAIEQLSGLSARRALVVADGALVERTVTRRVVEELAKSEGSVELVRAPDPPDSAPGVEELSRTIRAQAPDWVVVLGGGRTIDGAKAARLHAERPEVAFDAITPMHDVPDPPRVRLAAIPTTSGSGAEASGTADLTADDGSPIEVAHRSLTPDWALIDPAFAATLSPDQVLDGSLETAGQALEAFVSAWSNPFSDALARDAFATAVGRVSHALRWSDDPDARAALHYAATGAGLASSNAQRGVGHALARALVGPSRLSYGRLVGVLLPHVIEFDRPAARERLEILGATVERDETGPRPPLAARISRLLETFRFPTTLAAAGIDRSRFDAARSSIVANALRSPAALANPRVPSAAELEQLLDKVMGP